MTSRWRLLVIVVAVWVALAGVLLVSGCQEQHNRPRPRRPPTYQKKRKKPPVVKKTPAQHAAHEHPHPHPHNESDHHHHPHPHPHLSGPNGHHHPY